MAHSPRRPFVSFHLGKRNRFSLDSSKGGVLEQGEFFFQAGPQISTEMNTSKSVIAVALQIAACAGFLTKEGKASPISTGAGDDARIGDRIAKVRQMLSQTADAQVAGVKEVNGVSVNWWNWAKHWHNGGWRNLWGNGGVHWGNGGWGNGAGFRVPPGWANIGWPNGGVRVRPGWFKYWWNH